MKVFAPAKVNLALHVTGRRADGYHLLDSLVVFAGVGDWITVEPSDTIRLTVTGPKSAGVPTDNSNLVWKAAEAMGQPVAITLEKQLPNAGGIGGGSADAAATLYAIEALFGDAPLPPDQVLALGADLPVCHAGFPSRMSGIGEVIEEVPALPPLWCVLVNAGIAVPTGPVFKSLETVENPALPALDWTPAAFISWLSKTRNDLEPPAMRLVPEIATVLDAIAATEGCRLARMSGSGGTCFGLCDSEALARAAADVISRRNPAWWVAPAPILTERVGASV